MRRAARWIVRALAAIGFLFVFVTATPIDDGWIKWLAGPWNNSKGDVPVVLGSDAIEDVIGWSSYWRSVYAVRAWREGVFREVVVTAGSLNGQVPAAERMRDFMASQGIPASAIRVEGAAQSTRENALKSKVLLDNLSGRKVLLTSDYHMFRAYRVFRKAGLAVEPRPFPESAKRANIWNLRWPVFLDLCQEMAKSAYYYLR